LNSQQGTDVPTNLQHSDSPCTTCNVTSHLQRKIKLKGRFTGKSRTSAVLT